MLLTLMLSAAAISSQPEPNVPLRRASAALTLSQEIERAEEVGGHSAWISAARATIDELGPGGFSATLEQSVEDARWRALSRTNLAGERLGQELRVALKDLEFSPVREAQLPVGYPEPTPVREIELKSYPKVRQVYTDMQGDGSRRAFWQLFRHIKENDIAMTAPVEMTYAQSGDSWEEGQMAFLYGSTDMGDLGPAGSVEVIDAEPGLFLSIGCRGSMNRSSLEAAYGRLVSWLDCQAELEVAGELRSMGYNSPMIPRSRQYFEVQLPVKQRDSSTVVLDFGAEDATSSWGTVNDGVMGGLSSSRFFSTGEGSCVFEGRVSLENNGGFASVRTRPAEMGLEGAKALRLSFRGDGKAYKLRVRTSGSFRGVNYEVVFPTEKGVWQERSFAIEDFVPLWRGRLVRDAPELAPEDIRSVGFLISDKQAGPFRLEVATLSKE